MYGSHKEQNWTYVLRGTGAWNSCSVIQAKLAEHGACSFTRWAPGPPNWQFRFDTHLTAGQVQAVLGDLLERYHVTLERAR